MKRFIALCLVLLLGATPAFAIVTPTVKGKALTSRGMMVWGTFTGLPKTTSGSTTITIPGINKVNSLSTWAASVVATQGACRIIAVAKNVITVTQEAASYGISSGYFWFIGK